MLGMNQVRKVNIAGDRNAEQGRLDFWGFAVFRWKIEDSVCVNGASRRSSLTVRLILLEISWCAGGARGESAEPLNA